MQVEPVGGRALERAAAKAELMLHLRADIDLVAR